MSSAKFEAFNAAVSEILEFGIELFVSYRYCILLRDYAQWARIEIISKQ